MPIRKPPSPPANWCAVCGAVDRQTRAYRGTCRRCTGEAFTIYTRQKTAKKEQPR